MRARQSAAHPGESLLAEATSGAISAERTKVEGALGHEIRGRYLGTRNGHPDVCWIAGQHAGTHL